MASSVSSSKAPCATCGNKAAGIFRCEGCVQVFCRKHLNEHRDLLSHQLDEIVLEHDTLQQTIVENENKQNLQHLIVKEIDKWEKDSIVKIQQLAEEVRQQVKQLTTSQTASKELHDLAERLQKARADDGFVETDLHTWTTILQKLKDDVNIYCPSISIQEDRTQTVVGKIYVSTTRTTQHSRQNERFGERFGTVRIDNNGCLATQCGPGFGTTYVRGTGEYSSGKHYIRFLFQKSNLRYITWFDIVSKLMSINGEKSHYKSYGWLSDDSTFCAGRQIQADENFLDMKGQATFEMELRLDCDTRKISYVNQGTKNRREMDVDIAKCPFPWQVRFYLFEVGDCVRLLS